MLNNNLPSSRDIAQSTSERSQRVIPLPKYQAETLPEVETNEGGLELGRLLEAIWRRKLVVLGVTSVVLALTILWDRTRSPSYQGYFELLVEPATVESQVVSSLRGQDTNLEDQGTETSANSKSTLDYSTQIQILRSKKLLSNVIDQFQDRYPEFSYETLAGALTIERIKNPEDTKVLQISYLSDSAEQTEQIINSLSEIYLNYSYNERVTNTRRAVRFIESQLPSVQNQVRTLESKLQAFRERYQLIEPSELSNQVAGRLGENQQQILATQVELVEAKQRYKQLEGQLSLQPKSIVAASVLSDAPDYQQLVRQLQETDVELESLRSDLNEDHPKVISMKERRARLLPLIERKSTATLGKTLASQVEDPLSLPYQSSLRQDLSKQFVNTAVQIQVLESKLSGLKTVETYLSRQNAQLPAISREYDNLKLRLQIATDQLNNFLYRREEMMVNAARQEVPWELLKTPTVFQISSASLLKNIFLGTALGLLLGVGAALLIDRANNVFYSLEELRKALGMAILGIIPESEAPPLSCLEDSMPIVEGSDSSNASKSRYRLLLFAESFRLLYSQIRFLNPDHPVRSMVLSSPISGEGKSTIGYLLAKAAAAMGQRVLFVDADLRKPPSQKYLQESTELGLTDIISQDVDASSLIQQSGDHVNLFTLSSGVVPLDPTSLLASQKMKELMASFHNSFDFVVYDTSPLVFADSLLLTPETDGVLLVTRLGKTSRDGLKNALNNLSLAKAPVLGCVANSVDVNRISTHDYYVSVKV